MASSNTTGAVSALQEDPHGDDGSWVTATNTTLGVELRVSFPTPASGLKTGAGLQKFQIRLRPA